MRDDNNTRNTLIFIVSAVILLVAYQFFVIDPAARKRQAELEKQRPAAAATQARAALAAPVAVSRAAAVAASARVPVATPSLTGTLSLRGARLDDLFLAQYREAVEPDSPPVELLRPEGTDHPFFADIGWVGQNIAGLPTPTTDWTLVSGARLAPGQPVTLSHTNGAGLTFTRVISVDDQFMFTVTDTVSNQSGQSITLAPYASVQRQGIPTHVGKQGGVVHEGAIAWLGQLRQLKYDKWKKAKSPSTWNASGGWIGITDKYWLTAVIPDQKQAITGTFNNRTVGGVDLLDANYVGAPRTIASGRQVSVVTHVFAGAKRVPVLKGYSQSIGAPKLDYAVDWGTLGFLTRPIFAFLAFIQSYVGNFGVAILILTVCVRVILFPLANKQYESMTKMKKVQPQMEELRKRFKDDPAKQQQELMALYQREKVNPVAGCLPILLTIPVFLALFKVLNVSIEMRHAPFVGWIHDLSARDPTTIWNLFGAIPWDPASAPLIGGLLFGSLHIGVLPILYGITTWLTTAMSPPAADPVQQRIMQLMPLLFTFIMAQFAIGLLIYYTWSNLLSIVQQYVIMRRFNVDTPIDAVIRKLTGKPSPAS